MTMAIQEAAIGVVDPMAASAFMDHCGGAIANLSLSPLLDLHGFGVCYPLAIGGATVVSLSTVAFLRTKMTQPPTYSIVAAEGPNQNGLEAQTESNVVSNPETDFANEGVARELQLSQWALLTLFITGGVAFLVCLFCISSGGQLGVSVL